MRRRCYLAMLGVIGLCLVGNLIGGEIPSEMLKGHEDAVASIETQGGAYYPNDSRMHFVANPNHADLTKAGKGADFSVLNDIHGLDMVTLPAIDGPDLNAINNPDLRVVIFYGGTFSDEEFLAFLSRHPKLVSLNFFSPPTNLTGKAFTSWGSLERLDYIQLKNVPITDEGIAALPKSLTKINITYGDITPKCLESLAELSNLEVLSLGNLKGITDKDVEQLKSLEKLRVLGIRSAELTNVGVEHLSHLSQLEMLEIRGEKISNGGIRLLNKLKNLGSLHVYDSQVSTRGLIRLRQDIWGPEDTVNRFITLQSSVRSTPKTARGRRRR